MLFILTFILVVKNTSLKEYYVISNRKIPNHYLNNFQDIISLKESSLENLNKDDPLVAKFEEKKENKYYIKLGKRYLHRENDALLVKGKELIPDDNGFLFMLVAKEGYGYQIQTNDKCLEVGEDNGPLDGFEIILAECTNKAEQIFVLDPIKLSNEPIDELKKEESKY